MGALKRWGSAAKLLIKIILPVCLILAGIEGWDYFKSRELKMKRIRPQRQAITVETIPVVKGSHIRSIQAMGTVMPDKQVILKAKVSGEVISISDGFVQGGIMKKGQILLTLEDSDYVIEVHKAQSALDKALSSLAIEKGSQMIAKEELKLINEASQDQVKATDLALRKPQLIQAEAEVERARADFEKARLNLSRTKVVVPFNCLVLEPQVHIGSLVSTQGVLATLVDVDAYRVEAQVPPDRLEAIRISETKGSDAIIQSQYSGQTWQGRVVRTTGKMSGKSRMAGVIIMIPDPLGLKDQRNSPQLLLDDHVAIKILGKPLENVFSLPRSLLREKNTVWVYNSGILDIREVSLAWKEEGRVFVQSGISSGDAVITSDLPAPVDGMALELSSGDRP